MYVNVKVTDTIKQKDSSFSTFLCWTWSAFHKRVRVGKTRIGKGRWWDLNPWPSACRSNPPTHWAAENSWQARSTSMPSWATSYHHHLTEPHIYHHFISILLVQRRVWRWRRRMWDWSWSRWNSVRWFELHFAKLLQGEEHLLHSGLVPMCLING